MQNSCNTIHPRDMICFRYIIVNTVHKGDKKDDDDDDDDDDDEEEEEEEEEDDMQDKIGICE